MSKKKQKIYSFDIDKVLFMFKVQYFDANSFEVVNRKLIFEHLILLLQGDISYFSKHYEYSLELYTKNEYKYRFINVPISVYADLRNLYI